jgi:hypothetical protein
MTILQIIHQLEFVWKSEIFKHILVKEKRSDGQESETKIIHGIQLYKAVKI